MPVVTMTPEAGWVMCIGPPLPLQVPVTLAGDLGPEHAQRHALGQHVVDAAIDGADLVVIVEVDGDGRGDDLLPALRIIGHHEPAGADDFPRGFVVLHDQVHAAVDLDLRCLIRDSRIQSCCGGHVRPFLSHRLAMYFMAFAPRPLWAGGPSACRRQNLGNVGDAADGLTVRAIHGRSSPAHCISKVARHRKGDVRTIRRSAAGIAPARSDLDEHRTGLAAAGAHGGDAEAAALALQIVDEGGEHAPARGADGVADGAAAAGNIHGVFT